MYLKIGWKLEAIKRCNTVTVRTSLLEGASRSGLLEIRITGSRISGVLFMRIYKRNTQRKLAFTLA